MRKLNNLIHTFVLEPPLSPSEIAQFQSSGDPWEQLAYLVHRATQGDFRSMGRVGRLMRSYENALFWSSATSFAGMAGPWETIAEIAESFLVERHRYGVQYYVSDMLMYSCNPGFAETLVELYEAGQDSDIRDHVARNLSLLLEPTFGDIWIGAPERYKHDETEGRDGGAPDYASMDPDELFAKVRDYEAFKATVLGARDAIRAMGTPVGSAVFGGAQLDARSLATTLSEQNGMPVGPANRVFEGVRLLSGMVGKDCTGIRTRAGNLSTLGTSALLEDILDDPAVREMVPGVRYFFGHRVPD